MITKIIFTGICICIINLLLKDKQGVFSLIINLTFIIFIIVLIFDEITTSINTLTDLMNFNSNSSKMLNCLYKSAAVCILSKFATDICQESGNKSIGDIIDFATKIILLIFALPFIENIIKTASAFIK